MKWRTLLWMIPVAIFYAMFMRAHLIFGRLRSWLREAGVPTHPALNHDEWYPLLGLALWAIVLALAWRHREHFGFRRPHRADWHAGLAGFAALFLVAAVSRITDPGYDAWYAGIANLSGWAMFSAFLVTMPFQVAHEELFTRGLIQPLLSRALARFWMMLAVSLLFALAHYFPAPGAAYHAGTLLVFVLLGSWILVSVFEKTRSLLILFFVHLAYNTIVLFQVYFHVAGRLWGELLIFIPWGILFVAQAKPAWKVMHHTLKDWKHGVRLGALFLAGAFLLWWGLYANVPERVWAALLP